MDENTTKSKRKTIQGSEPKVIPTFIRPDSNPNGANQFLLDPRQIKMWGFYTDIKNTKTFANAYQSAIAAGYAKQPQPTSPNKSGSLKKHEKATF